MGEIVLDPQVIEVIDKYMPDNLYKSIDKNMIKEPVAYCKSKKAYLSKGQMKSHRCASMGCMHLRQTNEGFWEERRRIKKAAKERKKNLYNPEVKKNNGRSNSKHKA